MGDHALREAVRLDPPVERKRGQGRDEPPVRPDRAPDQSFTREVIESAGAASRVMIFERRAGLTP
jgi:hypothetical protein